MDLVPLFGGAAMEEGYPSSGRTAPVHGMAQGLYITLHPDASAEIIEKITGWYRDRDDVDIVDVGTSDKAGLGFVLMEWIECEIDPLLLAILRDEPMVGDFTLYGRAL